MPHLASVDWMILLIYFFFVLSIGVGLKQSITGSAEYLLAGRAMPTWLSGLAFLGASLGSMEVLGMGAAGARYGLAGVWFFAIGSVIPLVFVALYMMPTYYGSQARSVPGYLGLRFDGKTRALNAIFFLVTSILAAALAFYAMAHVCASLRIFVVLFHAEKLGAGGVFALSIALPAAIVLAYVLLGGLAATMYSQVMQFLVLVAGFLPVVFLGLKQTGGWSGIKAGLTAAAANLPGGSHAAAAVVAIVLGIVLTAGYWCADFSVLQNAMAAENLCAAQRAPVLAAIVRILLPLLLVVPGILAIGMPTPQSTTSVRNENGAIYHEITVVPKAAEHGRGLVPAATDSAADPMGGNIVHGSLDYAMATPNLLAQALPTGLLGLSIAALLACLVGGVAARISACATVFTCDIYQPWLRKDADDHNLLVVGRLTALAAVLLSAGAACAALCIHGIPDLFDLIALALALFNAPALATVLLGIFWKRTTGHGAFAGLAAGIAGGWVIVLCHCSRGLMQSLWIAIVAIAAIAANLIVTVAVSLATEAKPETELTGLVHSLPAKPAKKAEGAMHATIHLDLRIPMGMMFSMAGAVLLAYGLAMRNRSEMLVQNPAASTDLWWGVAVLVFGMIILSLGRKGQGHIETQKRRAQAKGVLKGRD